MMQIVDLIILARWVLPVVPKHALLERQAVVVHDGKVIAITAIDGVRALYQAKEMITLDHHVLMPGLINAHTHAAMSLMRGITDDLPLMEWLERHIWPLERQCVSHQFVRDGTVLACAEMLAGGVTTFNDMYFYPEAAASAALQMGMRAHIGLVVMDFASNYAVDAQEYIMKGTAVRDFYKTESSISFGFAPHAPYTVSDDSFTQLLMLSEQLNVGVHTHLHETLAEIEQGLANTGLRPLSRLANIGLLSEGLSLAHCVHLNASEMKLLAEHACHIVHCPSSNLKLASGIAPIKSYQDAGINVALGTDGAASNNRLDMFAEMRLAALLAKGQSGDATAVGAFQAIEMATINGAKALGLVAQTGSLEVGKYADMIAIKLIDTEMQPCYDVVSHLVYVADRKHVTHTWVEGDLKYYQPEAGTAVLSGVEPQELKDIVNKWQGKFASAGFLKN